MDLPSTNFVDGEAGCDAKRLIMSLVVHRLIKVFNHSNNAIQLASILSFHKETEGHRRLCHLLCVGQAFQYKCVIPTWTTQDSFLLNSMLANVNRQSYRI